MRFVARRPVRFVELERWTSWLAPLSVLGAAMWGGALGLGATVVAMLVYGDTHGVGFAALSGVGALAASASLLILALGTFARRR